MKKRKVLFLHNSVAEYRIEFWKYLTESVDLDLLITNKNLDNRIYGLEKDVTGLNISYFDLKKSLWHGKWNVRDFDTVILPPADRFKEFLIGLFYAIGCKLHKKKCIYWTEHWEAEVKDQSILRFLFNITKHIEIGILARLSDVCIASGTKAADFYKQLNTNINKIVIATDSSTSPENQDSIDFAAEYGIPDTAEVVLYFGRVVERKGLEYLLKAFEVVSKQRNEHMWLMICGEGPYLDAAKQYVEQNKISRVVFTGKIQPIHRKKFYDRASVFVLPSYPKKGSVEIWGLTVNEALEVGTPVVATNAVGAAFDLLDGKDGLMIPHSSIEELANAIEKYSNKSAYKQHCKEIANKYSVKNMATVFEKCINNNR